MLDTENTTTVKKGYRELIDTALFLTGIEYSKYYKFSEDVFIEDVLGCLSDKKKTIVYMRFGMQGYQPSTFTEIANRFGVSASAVSTSFYKSLRKITRSPEIACVKRNIRLAELLSETRNTSYSIDDLIDDIDFPISARARNVLKLEGINTVRELTKILPTQLMRVPNCGRGTMKELDELLQYFGKSFANYAPYRQGELEC